MALQIDINTSFDETSWKVEYAESANGPWTPGPKGTISEAEADHAGSGLLAIEPEPKISGLAPEVAYHVRVSLTNTFGSVSEEAVDDLHERHCETEPLHALPGNAQMTNVTATSAYALSSVNPDGAETHWSFQYATSEQGPWTSAPDAEGTISQAEAARISVGGGRFVEAELSGLDPGKLYFVRLLAESEPEYPAGSGKKVHKVASSHDFSGFETAGQPTASTLAVHVLHGEDMRALGVVDPNSAPLDELQRLQISSSATGGSFTLSFKGQTTEPIAYVASRAEGEEAEGERIERALGALSTVEKAEEASIAVREDAVGVFTIEFQGALAGADQPQIVVDGSQLTPTGTATVTVTTIQDGAEGYDTHYHFQYITEGEFQNVGWTAAENAPELDLGAGSSHLKSREEEGLGNQLVFAPRVVGEDLPGLKAGETYRYRLVADNNAPGNPVAVASEQTLTVPRPAAEEAGDGTACPNEALRTGPSARLPDCRTYEQVTPVDKEGNTELFAYGFGSGGALVGEDGDHMMLDEDLVNYGAGPDAGQSPYFFSRTPGGWKMTAAAVQPEAGLDVYVPNIFNPNLTELGLTASYSTGENRSPDVEFKAGPPGGPYTMVATVPRRDIGKDEGGGGGGWVAASADFSKLILQLEDHTLLGHNTGTASGYDLYEYSAQAGLHQVNGGLGTCGAQIARGSGESAETAQLSSPHAVSADGSRVLFTAVPGTNCSSPAHLYMRVDGTSTVDLGAYSLYGADPSDSKLLLTNAAGELFLYETEQAHLSAVGSSEEAAVEEQLGLLSRYSYELPPELGSLKSEDLGAIFGFKSAVNPQQIIRYDRLEHLVECLSCASSFNPEPRLGSYFGRIGSESGRESSNRGSDLLAQGRPGIRVASANGDYVFFDTPAALVPGDVDGEVAPETEHDGGPHPSDEYSLSSDVYEWRRDGLHGCAKIQGCLSLLTNGHGGYLNLLIGTTPSGNDVFIYTSSQLVPSDNDTAGDIYDARVDGGIAEPAALVECEGDSCSTPFAPPTDLTPASATFQGAGDVAPMVAPSVRGKPKAKRIKSKRAKKAKKKRKGTPRRNGKRVSARRAEARSDGGAK